MRRFNYTGPVYCDEHYMVKRQEMYIDFKKKIDQGRYFTIFAPRQMGKTTFLKEVIRNINQDGYYLGITIDFERYRGLDRNGFYKELKLDLEEGISRRLSEIGCEKRKEIEEVFGKNDFVNHVELYRFVKLIGRIIPDKKLVLLIDEFDGVPIEITGNFLYTLRDMYLRRREEKAFSIYSIGLVGVKNIRELNFGSTSPFNIATQVRLESFTLEQSYELINQYIEETGQKFQQGVIEKIHFETGGHPFLINRLCAILTEDVVRDRANPVTLKDLQAALDILLKEHNSNFDSLKNNAKRYEEPVKAILFASKDMEYRPHSETQEKLIMYGVIKEDDGQCEISNPTYKKVLLQYFTPEEIQSSHLFPNGITPSKFVEGEEINLRSLLIHFKEFVERIGLRLFDIVPSRKESAGQYLLMSYLDLFIRTLDGYSIIETPSGRGRIDVLLHYKGKRYVIELKIWRGKEYFEKGKRQLIDYLRSEDLEEGCLVLFDPREKEFKEFKKNRVAEEKIDGYRISSFVINI